MRCDASSGAGTDNGTSLQIRTTSLMIPVLVVLAIWSVFGLSIAVWLLSEGGDQQREPWGSIDDNYIRPSQRLLIDPAQPQLQQASDSDIRNEHIVVFESNANPHHQLQAHGEAVNEPPPF
jgi:hypothetical protein